MPGFEGQMRNKRERHRHLRLTGSNRPWEERGWWWWCCVGRCPLSMPSEEECLVMATQWALPSADGVCTSRPGPFSIQSSEQPDQFTREWTQSQRMTHAHIHTSFMYDSSSDAEPRTAARRLARIGIYSCMQKKKEIVRVGLNQRADILFRETPSVLQLKFTISSLHAQAGESIFWLLSLHPDSCKEVLTHQVEGAFICHKGGWRTAMAAFLGWMALTDVFIVVPFHHPCFVKMPEQGTSFLGECGHLSPPPPPTSSHPHARMDEKWDHMFSLLWIIEEPCLV